MHKPETREKNTLKRWRFFGRRCTSYRALQCIVVGEVRCRVRVLQRISLRC